MLERVLILAAVALLALVLSLVLIVVLRPWLERYALARPNARSSHHRPTPQGGGIAVVAAALVVAWGALALFPSFIADQGGLLLATTAAAALLALVGAVDDIRPLSAAPRLTVQCIAAGGRDRAAFLPNGTSCRLIPWWVERLCLFVGLVWFVNLTNFMDGIDWMTVAEVVPLTGAFVLFGLLGALGMVPTLVAAALLGAILGFAPFNRPVARLFLGDVGSLPIGLLVGWLLLELAAARPSGGGNDSSALLSRRHDQHVARAHLSGRAVLAGAPPALLSARGRRRLSGSRDRRAACSWSISRWSRSR